MLMADTEAAHRAAAELFDHARQALVPSLPPSAEVLHIGATAVPGCLTKGDLDIVIRVERYDFAAADALLACRFARNADSIKTEDFAAFEDTECSPHLGIQLTTVGGLFDVFHHFSEALRGDPSLLVQYNNLKLAFRGKPMVDYREAKDRFVADVLWRTGATMR